MTVYLVRDLVFTSKIREAAEHLGVAVEGVRQAAAVVVPARRAQLVIVDLRLPDALEALDLLARDPEAASVATVGFVDHERIDVMETARALGCKQVLAKGEFASKLPGLLR
jgi:CheY-like chemotaxis protein